MEYMIINGELCHYGLKGMKWGQRRWQNTDGTFNEAGKQRYFGKSSSHRPESVMKLQKNSSSKNTKAVPKNKTNKASEKELAELKAKRAAKAKKIAIAGAAVVATGLAAYGGYKLYSKASYNKALKDAITREAYIERQRKGEQALARLYDQMAIDAMNRGATSYSFKDTRIGYSIEMGKRK